MNSDRELLLERFRTVRAASIAMCNPLEPDDYRIQPIKDVSPPWWNLGHTSWFFAHNILRPFTGETTPEDREYHPVLNSYYVTLGPRLPQGIRGLLTRPTVKQIYAYRESVDERMRKLIWELSAERFADVAPLIRLGLEHERQHQELFYTEIKYIGWQNPLELRLKNPYRRLSVEEVAIPRSDVPPAEFVPFAHGMYEFGNREGDWSFDNELPGHPFFISSFELANRLTTNKEYLEFVEDGGYQNQLLWLDNGWNIEQRESWRAPLYWEQIGGEWWYWTLSGMRPVARNEPVCHVSFFEADAFARWKSQVYQEYRGVRLPTEREWEHAARMANVNPWHGSNFVDTKILHPLPVIDPRRASESGQLFQMFGDVWEWTSSSYEPYPGYQPFAGDVAEYNGKFMDGQRVLRGGSCTSEREHLRISYRNFWAPATRFQFSGIRLAKDLA